MLVASFLPQIFLLYDFHSSYKHIFFTFGPNLKDLLNLWAKSWGKWSFEKRRRSQMTEGTLTVEHVCCITVLYSDLEQHHYSCQEIDYLATMSLLLLLPRFLDPFSFPPPLFNDLWKQLIYIGSKRTTNLPLNTEQIWYLQDFCKLLLKSSPSSKCK